MAKAVREWITAVGARTAYIEPGSRWETGCIESFNARLRDGNLLCVAEGSDHHRDDGDRTHRWDKPPAPEMFVPAPRRMAGRVTPAGPRRRQQIKAGHSNA